MFGRRVNHTAQQPSPEPRLGLRLVVPPWVTHSLSDPLELDRIFKDHTPAQFSYLLPKQLLPRSLRRWDLEWTHLLLPRLDLFRRHLDVGCSFLEIDTDHIAVLEVS